MSLESKKDSLLGASLVHVSSQCAKARLHFPRIGLKVAAQPLLFGPASKRITKARPGSLLSSSVSMLANRAYRQHRADTFEKRSCNRQRSQYRV